MMRGLFSSREKGFFCLSHCHCDAVWAGSTAKRMTSDNLQIAIVLECMGYLWRETDGSNWFFFTSLWLRALSVKEKNTKNPSSLLGTSLFARTDDNGGVLINNLVHPFLPSLLRTRVHRCCIPVAFDVRVDCFPGNEDIDLSSACFQLSRIDQWHAFQLFRHRIRHPSVSSQTSSRHSHWLRKCLRKRFLVTRFARIQTTFFFFSSTQSRRETGIQQK